MLENCKLKSKCKAPEDKCNFKCYPHTVLHGVAGTSGLWASRNVPKLYDNCSEANLPQLEPVTTFKAVQKFLTNSLDLVAEGNGLFLFSISNQSNKLGTGNGKTTTAVTVLNEFLLRRVIDHTVNGTALNSNPVLFMPMAEFQNCYNSQFRGSKDSQELASELYYHYKDRMKRVELLVVDDIAIRNGTEAFLNEFYEIVNHRVNYNKATVYTSNEPLKQLSELLGERIVSRIEGSTVQLPFTGKDHRRKEWI